MLRIKALAAAVLLAAGASASAQIAQGTTGNGELFLVAYDSTNFRTLVLDTNVTVSSAISGTGATIFDGNVGSLWSSFFSAAGATIGWAVYGSDVNAGGAAASVANPRGLVSATPGAGVISGSQLQSGVGALDGLLTNVNPSLSASVNAAVFTSTAGTATTDGTSYGTVATSIDTFFANRAVAGTLLNAVGATTNLGYNQVTAAFGAGATGTFADVLYQGSAYTATLSSTGQLTIAAVPEPETYALMLAGLFAVGAIVRRRTRV